MEEMDFACFCATAFQIEVGKKWNVAVGCVVAEGVMVSRFDYVL